MSDKVTKMTNRLMKLTKPMKATAFVFLLVAIASAIAACGQADGADATKVPEPDNTRLIRVETMTLVPETFQDKIQLTGVVDALKDVTISAEAGGRVVEILPLGSNVSDGVIVARFDDRVLKSQLEAAQAAYELAEDTYRRQKALYQDSVISALEYENVRTRRDQAASTLEQARKMFADTRLTSPITGRVEQRFVEKGELVAPGSPVVRVVDTRHVKIRAGVPERYATDIRESAPAWVRLSSAGLEEEAKLTFVGRFVDVKSRTFPVEIDLENTSARLKPEMVVDVSIERRSLADALVVPQTALVHDDLGTGLYVVSREGDQYIADRKTVITGPSFNGTVVIESGVESGDQIVVVGQSNLTDGNPVQIVSSTGV